MAVIEVTIPNLNAFRRALRDYPKIANPIAAKAINASLGILHKKATKPTVPWRTGNLAQSFAFGIRQATPQKLWGSIRPTAKYAAFVEFGTRPHAIYPRTKRALAWEQGGWRGYVTSRTGRQYYKRIKGAGMVFHHVQHPGTKPNPFMERIVARSTNQINKTFNDAYDKIMGEIAKRTNLG